jgi:hypothetical protein
MIKKKPICKIIVKISDVARNLKAVKAINSSKTTKCATEAPKYRSAIVNNVGCIGYFKIENTNNVIQKTTIPISASIAIIELKDDRVSFDLLWDPRFRSVSVVPEVKVTAIKTLEVIITTKYDLFITPNSLL